MCSPELCPILAKLYNKCLDESCFPSCWKSSLVVPVFKNDRERSDSGKYCPISLLPIITKIFESFINDSLTKHVDITDFFSDLQHGFRAFQSTVDIRTVLSGCIYSSLDAGGETRAIALDIWKAFDKVYHAGLLHKLKAYGVVGPILSILESSLNVHCKLFLMDSLHLVKSPMLEFFRYQFWGQPCSRFLLIIFLMRFYLE